jgi:adenylate cyclase
VTAESRRRLAAILAADVAGYSRLMGADERATVDAVNAARSVFRTHTTTQGGRVVDATGDSALAVFDSVVAAARCAIEIQSEMASRNSAVSGDRHMQFRIGVNIGDIIEQDDGTIYGNGVNVAARVQTLAAPGGIALSGEAHDILEGKIEVPMHFLGKHEVKNITRPVRLYMLDWRRTQPTTAAVERTASAETCSIAVLSFASLSDDKDTSRFAAGLVEEILDHLARAEHYRLYSRRWTLKVASRTASARFARAGEDIPAVARELGVGYVLEGSVRRVGNSIRVTAQLIRGEDGFHVWSKSYDQPLADDLALQTRLARNIAHLATAELFFDLWEPWALAGNAGFAGVAPAAVRQFIEAEYQYRQIRLGEGGDWALYEKLLRKAVEADPGFAVGHTVLAFVYMKRVGGQLPLREARAAAHAAIEKANTLAPGEPLTLWQSGEIQMNLDLDYAQAQATFEQVLEWNPNRIWMHYNLAAIAVREGRTREALQRLRTAAALDAGYEQAAFLNSYAWLLNVLGHYEQSLRISAEGLGLAFGGEERATNLRNQAHALIGLGRLDEAGPHVAESWDLIGHLIPEPHAYLWARIGEPERARRILDEACGESVDRHALALGHLALGDVDAAFAAIEAGIEDHDPLLVESLRAAEWWSGIRGDPRYRKVIELLEREETHTAATQFRRP